MFDHPLWVPEGGIPDWKEVTVNSYFYFLLNLVCKNGTIFVPNIFSIPKYLRVCFD